MRKYEKEAFFQLIFLFLKKNKCNLFETFCTKAKRNAYSQSLQTHFNLAQVSDEKLLKGCLQGNRTAQKQLYMKYKASMFGVCLRYAKNQAEAEDFLQEGFIKIFGDLYQYKPIGPLGGWMRRVVVNVALQHIRRRKDLFADVNIDDVAYNYSADEEVFSNFRMKALLEMIQKLPEGYRAVFNMYVMEGFSHKEIAKQLNITVNTSKSQLSRAKSTLRQMLEQQLTS